MKQLSSIYRAAFIMVLAAGYSPSAHAACDLVVNGTTITSPETRPIGTIIYNADHNVLQACQESGDWVALTNMDSAGGPPVPTDCDIAGQTCSDGTIYAGDTPDGGLPMYTTPCDYGMTWDEGSDSCTGSRDKQEYGSRGIYRGIDDQYDGEANTAALAAFGQAAHPAAYACFDLTAYGHDDWYLPAEEEQEVIYTYKDAIGNFDDSGSARWYFSSSEAGSDHADAEIFAMGDSYQEGKDVALSIRCVRKEG